MEVETNYFCTGRGSGRLGRKPFSVIPFITLFFFCRLAFSQDGAALYRKMEAAKANADKIAAARDFEECVRADTWYNNGNPIPGEVWKRTRWVRKPNMLRLDQVGPGDTYVLYFDGSSGSGWEILPNKTFAHLAGRELNFGRGYLMGMGSEFSVALDPNETYTSPAPNVIAISRKGDRSHVTKITLNPATFLPIKKEEISLTDPSRPVATQTLQYRDWEAFQGVEFPMRTINFHYGRKLADIRVVEIKLNSGLKPADLASTPQDLKPVMGSCAK
jgi:hypothetical protein